MARHGRPQNRPRQRDARLWLPFGAHDRQWPVATGKGGAIAVDAYSRTSRPSIYAVGDVTDRVQLTPVAIREGMAFAETVFNDNPTSPDHDLIATATLESYIGGVEGWLGVPASEIFESSDPMSLF